MSDTTSSGAQTPVKGGGARLLVSVPALFGAAALLLLTGLLLAFWWSPTRTEYGGFAQKIFYFHVPISETALVAFAVAFVAGVLYLRTQKATYDLLGMCAVRLGLVFSLLVMATGMIWGKAAWGTYWDWEPRLTTFLIACLLYAGYFVLRGTVEEESRRATYSALFAIIAFIDVPITFFATRMVPSGSELHPVVVTSSGTGMGTNVLIPFLISMLGMTLLFVALLRFDLKVETLKEALHDAKNRLGS